MNDDNNLNFNTGDLSGVSIDDILSEYYADSPFFSRYEEPVYDYPSDTGEPYYADDESVPAEEQYLPDYAEDSFYYAPEDGYAGTEPSFTAGSGFSGQDDYPAEEKAAEKVSRVSRSAKRGAGSLKSMLSFASGIGHRKTADEKRSAPSKNASDNDYDFHSTSVAEIFAEEQEEYNSAASDPAAYSVYDYSADYDAVASEYTEYDAREFQDDSGEYAPEDVYTGEYPAGSSDSEEYSSDIDSIIASFSDSYSPAPEIEELFKPEPEPERAPPAPSALPGDKEVRDYLDSLTSADFLSFIDEDSAAPQHSANVQAPELDPDDRFHLGGYSRQYIKYGDKEIDTASDSAYSPPASDSYSPSHWTAPADENDVLPSFPKFPGFGKRKAHSTKKASAPEDTAEKVRDTGSVSEVSGSAAASASAEENDELSSSDLERDFPEFDFSASSGYDRETGNLRDEDEDDFFPSSFKEYLTTVFNTLLVRIGRTGGKSKLIRDEIEDLGPELSAKSASKYYGSFSRSIRNRLRLSFIVLVILAWMSLGLPVSGAIKDCRVFALLCLALQLAMMVLCLDTVTTGIMNAVRGKPGAESMVTAFCFITSLDALIVGVTSFSTAHVPLCLISSLSLFGAELASLFNCRGLRKALRVPAIGRRSYAVSAESGLQKDGLTLLKSFRPLSGLVHRAEEAAPDETLFRKICIPVSVVCLLFSLITAAAKHAFTELVYIISAVFAPAIPVSALLCFSMPFLVGSVRLFKNGAAIAGWAGAADVGHTKNIIITDIDLFPESCVELESIRIFADGSSEKILAYAGTIISASGCGLAACFGDMMEKNGCRMRNIEVFEPLPGGGLKGVIDGDLVLCGNSDIMRLMNVKVPSRLVSDSSVLLAVNGVLYGIFNIKYSANQQVRAALLSLVRSNRHPVFAIRDFNITPDMLRKTFDISTDGYDFPPYADRFSMSECRPGDDSRIAAVVCREGLPPVVKAAETGRSVYNSVRINLCITCAGIFFGILTVFVKLLSAGSVSMGFMCIHAMLWLLPVLIISLFAVK